MSEHFITNIRTRTRWQAQVLWGGHSETFGCWMGKTGRRVLAGGKGSRSLVTVSAHCWGLLEQQCHRTDTILLGTSLQFVRGLPSNHKLTFKEADC